MKKFLNISIYILMLVSCFSSESDQSEIWGIEVDEFESNLQKGNYDFLSSIDFERMERWNRLSEIYRFHRGGAFYLSFIFEEMNHRENSIRFLHLEMSEGDLKKEAAREIYNLLSREGNWAQLSDSLGTYVNDYPDDYETLSLYTESLYKSAQFGKAVIFISSGFSSIYTLLSCIAVEDDLWGTELEKFLYNGATPEEVYILYEALMDKGLFYSAEETIRLYMTTLTAYYTGDYGESAESLKNLNFSREIYENYPSLVYSLRHPIENSNQQVSWGDKFDKIESFPSVFTAARLFLSNSDYLRADRLFRKAITLSDNQFEQDRARWYLMKLYENNIDVLAALIEEFAPLWNDPEYFADMLEEFLNLSVSSGEEILFNRIYSQVISYGDRESVALYSWIKYLNSFGKGLDEKDLALFLERMIQSEHMSYHNLLGTLLTGQPIQFDDFVNDLSINSQADKFINGFLDFSLKFHALEYSIGLEKLLNNHTLRELSKLALGFGDELRSIQLAYNISLESGQKHSINDIKLMYPYHYGELIDLYSRQYGFSKEILSGIIRTESAFTHDIISYAGAVGLSQLMPATAQEQARKLKIENPDLTDPETNIHIGSAYIKWILDRDWSENLSQMLIAYNAGGGNLRKWKRMYPQYSDELFVEAIPYKETRNYVKKVLTSSVIYGSVYGPENPEDIVRKIFPDFNTFKLILKE